jgi:hypothetical protein
MGRFTDSAVPSPAPELLSVAYTLSRASEDDQNNTDWARQSQAIAFLQFNFWRLEEIKLINTIEASYNVMKET